MDLSIVIVGKLFYFDKLFVLLLGRRLVEPSLFALLPELLLWLLV
jgi:hypothetical protein